MSSYQHQCMLGNVMRDSHPDYLTCGYCAKEFLLDNITLFIAHKTGGCDYSSYLLRTATFHGAEDTSAPLTCSTCSRVFMTARGLVHHVQEDHQMLLCLQKGPLLLPHKEIRPPPAHSSCNGLELTRPQGEQAGCCFPSSPSSCGQNDQPTDLSMTCSNSLGKARITCSEDKCQITLEPTGGVKPTSSATALPKKRKVLFQQNSSFGGEKFDHPAACSNRNRNNNSHEDVDCTDSCENNSGPTTGKEADDNEVSICVTAEYQQDTLCCVSLSTEKKEHDKHAQLKRLLQNKIPTAEPEEFQEQESGAKTITVDYEVPLLSPSNLESNVLRATANETLLKDSNHQGVFNAATSTDPHDTSSKFHKSNNVSRLAMKANTDRLFQTSIASESFSEELNILSLQHESSHSSSRQPKHHRLDDSGTSIQLSPRLSMPEENNTFPPQISFSCPSLDGNGKGSINSDSEHWNNMFLGDDHNLQPTPGITPVMSSTLLAINSLCTGIAQNETIKLKNSLSFHGPSTPVSDQATLDVYNDLPLLRHHHGDHSTKQQSDNTERFGEGLLTLLDQNTPSHMSNVQSKLPESSVSVIADMTGRHPSIQQWLNVHNQDYPNLTGTGSTNRPASEHLDPAVYENVEQPSIDVQDDTGTDSKAIKRRRYPTSRPFKCPSCDQAFNQRIHLKKHMSKHTGVKPFKCQQCDYSTVERSHLKVHYRIHTGEKPYRCMFCDYATAQNSTLKIHMKRHHETQTDSDCSNLKDNGYQPTGSFEDESWSLTEKFFLHRPLNTPTFDDERNPSSFLPGTRVAHTMSIDNSSLRGGQGVGDTRGGSSSPSASTDQGHQPYGTSVPQVQTAEPVTDRVSFRDAKRNIHRKSALTNRGLYDNSSGLSLKAHLVQNSDTNPGKTAAVEFKCSSGQNRGNLDCLSSEDSILCRDVSESGIFEDIQPSSVQIMVFQKGDKLQSTNEELDYLNRTSQLPAKSFAKRKQTAKRGNIQIVKSVKRDGCESVVNSVAEKDVHKNKEPACVVNSNIRVPRDNESISGKAKTIETFASNETMKTNRMLGSELLRVDVEDDDLECNSMDNVSVTIPTKAFVRG